MTRRFLIFAFLTLPLIAADITGKWTFQVDLGGASGSPTFTFQQKGEELTGTYAGQLGEAKLKGTVKGDKVEFQFETSAGTVVYKGTVASASTMKGTADYGGQAQGTWTAKKD
ncbi:MAG: hypothetical protein HYX27_22455 [Acidobacteria bacterium]|nr:hypothetical protein [Acidobacteriota bacterium]